MGKFTVKDSSDFSREHFVWFDGEYTGFSIEPSKFDNGDQVKFRVQYDDEDREEWIYATARVTPKTKLGKILAKWGEVDVSPGVEIDYDDTTGEWFAGANVVLAPGDRVGVMYGEQEKDPTKTTQISFRRTPQGE